MKIKKGDRVEAIDDAISGIVINITADYITIEDSDGFPFQYKVNEVILKQSGNEIRSSLYNKNIASVVKEKETHKRKVSKSTKPKERHSANIVIDLHIHHLTDSTKGMSNFDMLNLQIDTAKRRLEHAIVNRIPKIVFIHGVGEGVLRQELETLLRRYDNITFYDADYKTYGFGATEVRVFQNAIPNY